MHTVESFPYRVREIENIFIPMRDGARLAARGWRPVGRPPRPAEVENKTDSQPEQNPAPTQMK
uniref:hypothetical protein n=1 Tax=Nocardia cyriacigeorgica TaxID=135487 RepID=UPI0024583BD8